MTTPHDAPTIAPHQVVQMLIAEGLAGDEAGAVLLLREAEALPEKDGGLRFIVPETGGPPTQYGTGHPLPIDHRNGCAWNRASGRADPARVKVFAPLSQVQQLLDRLRQLRDRATGAPGVAAHPHAMQDAIRAAIGADHARAEEVLQVAQRRVAARDLAVWFAHSLDAWREKAAEWCRSATARPWLPVSPEECEALGSAEGCTHGGQVPHGPGWRIDTARGLAERQDGHGRWKLVGPVMVDGAALRALADELAASSPAEAAEQKPEAAPWAKDGPEWEAAQRDLIEWADDGDGWPNLAERGSLARFAEQLMQFAHQRGKDIGLTAAKDRARLLLDATPEQRETWCRRHRP